MEFFSRLLVSFSVVAVISVLQIKASAKTPSKEECVNNLIESCNKANYTGYGSGSSIMSTTENTPSGKRVQVLCLSDTEGTTCYQDRTQWFSCTPDHTATYKGKTLSANSIDGVDDEICDTSRILADKLGNAFIKSVNANVTAVVEKNRKELEQEMDNLHYKLSTMNHELSKKFRNCFPFCEHNPFGKGFPFNR